MVIHDVLKITLYPNELIILSFNPINESISEKIRSIEFLKKLLKEKDATEKDYLAASDENKKVGDIQVKINDLNKLLSNAEC